MNTYNLIAQAIGIVAMAFNIISYQQRSRKGVIAFQLFGGILFSINFFMLNAIVGCILNALAVIRAIVFLNKEKLHADRPIWLIGFSIAYVIPYLLTFTVLGKAPTALNFIIELLPVIAMIASTYSFQLTDAKAIRRYGLISSPSWLIYNISSFAIGAIICEVLSLSSIIVGMIRLDRKR